MNEKFFTQLGWSFASRIAGISALLNLMWYRFWMCDGEMKHLGHPLMPEKMFIAVDSMKAEVRVVEEDLEGLIVDELHPACRYR